MFPTILKVFTLFTANTNRRITSFAVEKHAMYSVHKGVAFLLFFILLYFCLKKDKVDYASAWSVGAQSAHLPLVGR